jgi:hypothetical protein
LEGGEDFPGKEKPAIPAIAHTIKSTPANIFSAVLNIIYIAFTQMMLVRGGF